MGGICSLASHSIYHRAVLQDIDPSGFVRGCRGGKTLPLPFLRFQLECFKKRNKINKKKTNILSTHAAHTTPQKPKGNVTQNGSLECQLIY